MNLNYTLLSEILDAGPCPIVIKAIHEGLNRANMKAISNAHKVQKAALLNHDFTIATGELSEFRDFNHSTFLRLFLILGATLKVKRNFVEHTYKDTIDKLYGETV